MPKKSEKIPQTNSNIKRRLIIYLIFGFILFFLLILRMGWLQFVQGSDLKERAYRQQVANRTITPKRGNIYDSTGRTLALSIEVDVVYVSPSKLKSSSGAEVNKAMLAQAFSDIFAVDYVETFDKLNSDSSSVKIADKVEHDKIELLETWLKSNNITGGVYIESETRRFYPYETLASNLIGFTGTDGQGLVGLEYSLDSLLSGTSGKIVTTTDSINSEIPNGEQKYISALDGNDIILTIDMNIQSICEKYLAQAVHDNRADGGTVIMMEPSTGNILAMATYPDYNINIPFAPNSSIRTDNWDELSSEEKNNLLYKMWNNTSVQNTYEPGSTFKIITAAAALEEGLIHPNHAGDFYCAGTEKVSDADIRCWRSYDPHGYQSLRDALANSCNPAFIQLGRKIGAKTLYKYYEAFGLFETTGSSLYGEQRGLFHNVNNVGEYELATISFGQRFTITPLQLITAVSSIANEGVLMKPNIVKEIKNTNTGSITPTVPTEVRQVVSKETADILMEMLDYTVTDGTGGWAKVPGYSIGGKTGTSEPIESNREEGYVASFIAVSPTVHAQVVLLVIIDDPKAGSIQGGSVAGPIISDIFGEVLPSLGIASSQNPTNSSNSTEYFTLPDIRNKTVAEAKTILSKFDVHIAQHEDPDNDIIIDQVPKPGISLRRNSDIYLYTASNSQRTYVAVPALKGMSAAQATNSLASKGLNIVINGTGIVTSQDIAADKEVEQGTVITVTLQSAIDGGY